MDISSASYQKQKNMEHSKTIEQRAVDFAGNREHGAGHGYPSRTADLIEKGYRQGALEQQLIDLFDTLDFAEYYYQRICKDKSHEQFTKAELYSQFKEEQTKQQQT